MPSWMTIFQEMQDEAAKGSQSALDDVRKKYISALGRKTDRNVICYYSAFLKNSNQPHIDINDNDKNMFMAVLHGMDYSKGLDLILHTPGGSVTAAESLVHYLNSMFNGDVRAIVPLNAFSAGSIMACGCKSIVMGKQSSIGPFDPWIGGISCHNLIDEFNEAAERLKTAPHEGELWRPIIEKISPTMLHECKLAIEMASTIVSKWLTKNMLQNEQEKERIAQDIVSKLNNPSHTKNHGRHIHADDAKEMGLVVEDLENDQEIQDLVLSIHHSYMLTIDHSDISKIIENQNGATIVVKAQ